MSKVLLVTGASKGIGAATAILAGPRGFDGAVAFGTDGPAVRRLSALALIEVRRDPQNRRVVMAGLTAAGVAVAARLDGCMKVATSTNPVRPKPQRTTYLLAMRDGRPGPEKNLSHL